MKKVFFTILLSFIIIFSQGTMASADVYIDGGIYKNSSAPLLTDTYTYIKTYDGVVGTPMFFRLIPSKTDIYIIETIGTVDTEGELYDVDGKTLEVADDIVGTNFKIVHELYEGETYYLRVTHYNNIAGAQTILHITGTDDGTLEAPPTATAHEITGTLQVGETLTGNYTYSDVNGDPEGTSTFKWYRADDSAGLNKAEIAGATDKTYLLQSTDIGKYISFEVTPVAATGIEQGIAVESPWAGAVTEVLDDTPTYLVGDGQTYPWTAEGLKQSMADVQETGGIVKLMGSGSSTLNFSEKITLEKNNITLDLYGQKLEYTSIFNGITVEGTSVLTVTDSSASKEGSYTAPYATALHVYSSSLTISGGKVIGANGAITVGGNKPNVSITGGNIESTIYSALSIIPTGGNDGYNANFSITGGRLSAPGTSYPVVLINPINYKGSTNITIGKNANISATGANGIALQIISQKTLTLTIDSDATITGGYGRLVAPSVNPSTVTKVSSKQKTVNFTLSNPEYYKNPKWKLYTTSDSETEIPGVSATSDGNTLTLTAEGDDLAAGTYYLAVAADPTQYYDESWRTALTVNPYVPASFNLTYDANGGSGSMANGTATEGVTFTLPANGFTPPVGMRFKAWAVGSPSGTQVNAGETHVFTENTTLYAIWEIPTYLVGDGQTYPWTADGLKKAMEAVNNTGGTVKLMGSWTNTLNFTYIISLNKNNITLDLNGKTLNYTGTLYSCGIAVNGSVLTVTDSSTNKDGSYTATNPDSAAFNANSGNLIISGGTVGRINVNTNGNLMVSGGKVTAKYSAILVSGANANVSITGGEIESTEYSALDISPTHDSAENNANISITGGSLSALGASKPVIFIHTVSSNGSTNITIGNNANITATETNGVALQIYSQKNLTLTIDSGANITGGYGRIAMPSLVSSTVSKESAKQKTVNFTLSSPEYYKNPTWKLYTTSNSNTVVPGVSVTDDGSTLTLTAEGDDLAAGTYYLAVAANPDQYYDESSRIPLTVQPYVPPAITGDVTISGTPLVGETLTLTNNTIGGDTPVWYATDSNTATGGTIFDGGVLTGAQAGKYIYVIVPADADHTGSITSNILGPVEKLNGPAEPSVSFSFDGTSVNRLMGATELMEYSLDGGTSWESCTADMDLTHKLGSITAANDIKVRIKETDSHKAGVIQTIDITQPPAPTIDKTDETFALNDGTITGVSNLMEYRKDGEASYTAITGSTLTGLAPGTYYVRIRAKGTALASLDAEVEIAAFTKITPTLADLIYSLANVDYDGSAKPLTVTAAPGKDLGAITVKYNGSTTPPINAGVYAITVDIEGNEEYSTVTGLSLGIYTINKIEYMGTTDLPAKVFVSGQAGATIELPDLPEGASYGTPTASGTVIMTDMSVLGTTLTYTAPAGTAGQTARITIPVTGAVNYNDYNVAVTVTYTPKIPQVISYTNSNLTKTYGDAKFINPLTQTTVMGTITYSSDDVSVATVDANTGEVTILAAGDGSVTITATAGETDTYAQATASYTVTVSKKSLTLKADDKSMNKGEAIPEFTYTSTGLVNDDAVITPPIMSTDADGTTSGTFDITITDGEVENAESYDITYTNGILTVAELLFTATVTNGTGSGTYAEGATVTITANNISGYTFTGWSGAEVTFADASARTTTFTMPAKAVTVTATYRQNSSGGGGSSAGSYPVPTQPSLPDQKEDSIKVTISDKIVAEAIEKAEAEEKEDSSKTQGTTIELNLSTGNNTASGVSINLPRSVQEAIINKGISNTLIVVDNPDIKINMDLRAITEINKQAQADVNITATMLNNSSLESDAKAAIGSRPVFELETVYGSNKQVQSFGGGIVSISIPYTLKEGERADNLCAVYVDEKGVVHWLANSIYDNSAKVLRFTTSHFSTYGVGYKQVAPSFTDIANHYRKDDIEFVTVRGLLEGTGAATFEPDRAITRAMLVSALGGLANADVSSFKQSSFTDVKNDAYYMGYIEWASKMGILSGIDGKFSPDRAVTREDMAVILRNYAKAMGITLGKVYEEVSYADSSKISAYAKDSVKELQMAGIITNKSNNLFDPTSAATRSEASAMLRRFIERAAGSSISQGWIMNDSGKWMYYEKGRAVTGRKEISGLIYEFNQYGETASSPGKPVENTDKEQKEEKPKPPSTPSHVIYSTYRVIKGDSFWKIAKMYKCSMYELAKINNKTIKDIIRPGEVLKIPNK